MDRFLLLAMILLLTHCCRGQQVLKAGDPSIFPMGKMYHIITKV